MLQNKEMKSVTTTNKYTEEGTVMVAVVRYIDETEMNVIISKL